MKNFNSHFVPRRLLLAASSACLFASFPSSGQADENFFGYSYGAETLPKGKWEVYNWVTARFGKGEGNYQGYDLKQEIEYGLTDHLQVSFYINERGHSYSSGAVEEEDDEGSEGLHQFAYDGNQLSFKYNLLSPYKDAFGLSFYVEPGYSLTDRITGEHVLEWELETKAILQKNFLDDQLITALNVTTEFEWGRPRPAHGEDFDGELLFETTGGVSYRVASNWFVGIEARYRTEFPNMDISNQESWAISAGPVVHYAGQHWWATLTWLPQISGAPHEAGRSDHLDLLEHEKNEIRLKVGYNF